MMDDRETEQLKCQIEQTRCNLADKLETLEERVVEPATAVMTESVTKVKEAVENTAEAVQSTMTKVTETFDLATHVRNYPLRMVAAGVATGFVLGQFLKPRLANAPTVRGPLMPLASEPEAFRSDGQGEEAEASQEAASSRQRLGPQAPSAGGGKLATEIQSVLIHALASVLQGLLGAALAEFIRRPQAPASTGEEPSRARRHSLDENAYRSDGELKNEPEWGDRFRSIPK